MATEIEELLVKLSADTANFRAEMKASVSVVESATSQMQKDISQFSKESAKNTSIFSQAYATMTGVLASKAVTSALELLKSGFSSFVGLLQKGVQDANAEEVALIKLGGALQSAGALSQNALDNFSTFASGLEATTGIADETIITMGSLISTMSGLSGGPLEKATEGAANLAARLGIDLETAARAVGKALDGNVAGLQRFGISVSEGKDRAETMANVLNLLGTNFDGAAAKIAGTFSGSLRLAESAFGNLFEQLAKSVQTNQTVIAVFKSVADIMNGLTGSAKGSEQGLRVFVGEGVLYAIEAARALVAALDVMGQGFRLLAFPIETTYNLIVSRFKAIQEIISAAGQAVRLTVSGDFDLAFQAMSEGSQNAKNIISDFATTTKQNFDAIGQSSEGLLKLDTALNRIETSAAAAQDAVVNGATADVEATDQQTAALVRHNDELAKSIEALNARGAAVELGQQLGVTPEVAAAQIDYNAQQEALDESLANGIISQERFYTNSTLLAQDYNAKKAESDKKAAADADKINQLRSEQVKTTLTNLASFQNSKSKELAAVGKAAAIAQATIDTYAGATKAYAQGGILGFITAASIVAAGLANVAKIAGVGLAGGIDSVPGVGNRDSFPAVLAPGERVVPAESNKDLTSFLSQQSQGNVNVSINIAGDFFESPDGDVRLLERIQRGILQTGFKLRTT
jgi:hypothetical protein